MIDFLNALVRSTLMLVAGLLVLGVVFVLVMVSLAFMLLSAVWNLLNGRRPADGLGWARFQRSAGAAMWQRYRNTARSPGRNQAPQADPAAAQPHTPNLDVEDVSYREAPRTRPNTGTDQPPQKD